METINEFIERKENEEIREALKFSLARVTALLPKANEDILVHTLSMLDKEERDRWVKYIQQEEILNNKAALLSVYGLIVSHKTLADAIVCAQASENILLRAVPKVVQEKLDGFKSSIVDIVADAVIEADQVLSQVRDETKKLNESANKLEKFASETFKTVEKAYDERSKHIDARFKAITDHADDEIVRATTEIDDKIKEIELVLSKRAVAEFRKAIVPAIGKAIGWKGFLFGVGVLTISMFLHDFVLKLLH